MNISWFPKNVQKAIHSWTLILKRTGHFVFAKSDSHLLKIISFICFNESPSKMIKTVFSFMLKALFVLKIIFVLSFWLYRKNGLIRNIRVISKFMTSQPGQETSATHILSNISWSKGNKRMRFGQFIKYNERNIFL